MIVVMEVCSCCGGSGIQRVGEQQFRTCLACLGQGFVDAEDAELKSRLDQAAAEAVNAVASSVAAR
ncbi:putative DnaJ type IV chaperone protein [Synechococcus sp. BMK-MC-1]|nr:putative DnaJ type IV chaperone protein [Synechococcus sp. BMK-MC-1]